MTTRRWIFFFIAVLLGLGLGLYYGWIVSPVQYVDMTPGTLRPDFRTDYTLMVAEVFKSDQDIDVAARRMALLGSQPPADMAQQALTLAQQYGYSTGDITLLQNLAVALQVWRPGGALQTPQATQTSQGSQSSSQTSQAQSNGATP